VEAFWLVEDPGGRDEYFGAFATDWYCTM
jgi:hypothetical protein